MQSFENIEKSLEERLDPKRRKIGLTQLKEHDEKKKPLTASKIFRIEFSESVPEKIKTFLNGRLQKILDFPEKFGMHIKSARHVLRFIDKTGYEEEMGIPLPNNVSLPASKIKYIRTSRSFQVMIILPEKLDTAEAIINITRNLFSKLYGNIFLDEKILPLQFYRQNINLVPKITASVPEIIDLSSKLNITSESFDKHCKSFAKSYKLSLEKQGDEIRKQLASEWRKKWQEKALTTEDQHTIDLMFSEIMESMRKNPFKIINSIIERVKKLNTQLNYILPHEMCDYDNFEKKHPKHYLRSILNKFEEISSLADFIDELNSELKNLPIDTNMSEISTQIRLRMQQLRREKKVIKFYVPEIPRDEELENIRQKFPLILIKMIPKGIPLKDWSKTVQRMEKKYSESVYSKIYSALHCLSLLTSGVNNTKQDNINTIETVNRLKKISGFLKYHSTEIKSTQRILGVLLEITEKSVTGAEANSVETKQLLPLDEFKTAWSYFIASVMTMIYYQDSLNSSDLPQGFNAENYAKSILRYVEKQCSMGINYFHIVKLFWLIYEEKKSPDRLTFLLFCLQNPHDILRFILNQVMRPHSESISLERRLEKLPNYGKAWVTAFQNRLDNAKDQP